MLGKALAITLLGSFVLLSAILQSTSPSTVHPVMILIVFILIYLLALGVLTFLILGINRLMKTFAPEHKKSIVHMSLEKSYYFASVLALAPVLYLGVRSVGYAGTYEIMLIALFEVIACFFVAKRK